jgi:endonuclease YncB( thermonuclease family)
MGRWAIIAAVALAVWPAFAGTLTGTAHVIDGDTMEVGDVTVRINGIDAAELGQKCDLFRGGNWACDDAAADRLAGLAGGRAVECEAHGNDPYGRIIATCFVEDVDLGRKLVGEGLAWAFVKYDAVYRDDEVAAKAAGLGIWQGAAQAPWDYRAARWERAVESSPREGCPIKGNINGEGERIYHTPWSPWYSRTKIDEGNGERWFCDEAEAVAAGWRAARFR